jgi:hypothetical protein
MKVILTSIVVLALLLSGCKDEPKHMETNPSKQSIGVASMEKDGTIVLQLRAELDGGANLGEGYFRYPPTDAEYQKILKHVGGLKPGESKDVLPWPEEKKK